MTGVDRYAVIGNPVGHVRTPAIHAAFAAATGEAMSCERLLAPVEGFAAAVERFRASGGRGATIVLPFNRDAYEYADVRSERARRSGLVNTLRFDADGVFGDSTEGAGFVADLGANLGLSPAGRSILIAGAGSTTRALLPALIDAHPAGIVVANRTLGPAEEISHAFGGRILASSYPALEGQRFDIVVNATAAAFTSEVPPLPTSVLEGCRIACDMSVGTPRTPFLDLARELGAPRTADGLGMLVEQSAETILVWRGVRPATAAILAALRTETP